MGVFNNNPEFVYLAEGTVGGSLRLKIGRTWNLPLRMKQLARQRETKVRLMAYIRCPNGAASIEKETEWHRALRGPESIGEWHKWKPETISMFTGQRGIALADCTYSRSRCNA